MVPEKSLILSLSLMGRRVFRRTLVSQEPLHLSGIWLRDKSSPVVGKPTTPPLPWKSALPPCVLNKISHYLHELGLNEVKVDF
eukprot:g61038.t1